MESLKNVAKMVLGVLVGIAVGYGSVMLVLWLADGGKPVGGSDSEGLDVGLLFLSVFLAIVWLGVTTLIHLIMHEAGHLIMGLLTGFRFLSFRVFKFTLVKTDEGLRWKRFHIAGTGGQCLMELPVNQDMKTAPWFWYNAGGVLMNLLLVVVAIILLRTVSMGIVGFSFFIMLAFVGIIMSLINGIPMISGGVSNDGNNLLMLWRRPPLRRFFVRTLQMAGQQSRGRRLTEMPQEWFEDLPVDKHSQYLEVSNRVNYMALLEDAGRYDEALAVGEELMSLDKALPSLLRFEVGGERVMLELLTQNRAAVVDSLWTRQLARYTEINSRFSPLKCAVLFTYELLHCHNQEKADTYRQSLLQHQNDYTMPGEARTALNIIENAQAVAERIPNE